MTMKPYGIDADRLKAMRIREDAAFAERTRNSQRLHERAKASMPCGVPMQWMAGLYRHAPIHVTSGEGACFEDVDGNRYLDMNLADLAAFLGFAPEPVTRAIAARAPMGASFLLPQEDGIAACELLAEKTGMPFWQFSGSASSANTEALRIARFATGREKIVTFEGRYHGHIDDTLAAHSTDEHEPEAMGLPRRSADHHMSIPFNDLDRLETALSRGDVACVIAEPMLTNCNIVFPDEGFWPQARALIDAAGALLIIDEAHCFSFAHGGLTANWSLAPDIMTLGKGIGTGLPFACFGLSSELGKLVEENLDVDVSAPAGLALGGTTYANTLALSAARAALEHSLTPAAYAHAATLGRQLGDGLLDIFTRHGLNWRAPVVGGRSGWVLFPDLPRNAREAETSLDPEFTDTKRVFMANRGVWEAVASAGPAASFAHTGDDIGRYLAVSDEFVSQLCTRHT